jgi:hypothetical protein
MVDRWYLRACELVLAILHGNVHPKFVVTNQTTPFFLCVLTHVTDENFNLRLTPVIPQHF